MRRKSGRRGRQGRDMEDCCGVSEYKTDDALLKNVNICDIKGSIIISPP